MGTNTTPDESLLYVEGIHLNEHAKKGNVEALEGRSLDIINMDNVLGFSLLNTSVLYAQDKFTEKLLQMGANVNPKDSDDRTPLDYSLEDVLIAARDLHSPAAQLQDLARERNIRLLLVEHAAQGTT